MQKWKQGSFRVMMTVKTWNSRADADGRIGQRHQVRFYMLVKKTGAIIQYDTSYLAVSVVGTLLNAARSDS